MNITDITMWTDLSKHQASELAEFDALYIGGGNTFSLLAQVLDSGEDKLITEYVRTHQQPVLAISERSGIVIEATGMRTVGFEPAYRFDRQGKFEV